MRRSSWSRWFVFAAAAVVAGCGSAMDNPGAGGGGGAGGVGAAGAGGGDGAVGPGGSTGAGGGSGADGGASSRGGSGGGAGRGGSGGMSDGGADAGGLGGGAGGARADGGSLDGGSTDGGGAPGVRIVGRTAPGASGATRIEWSGTSIAARFTGTQISIQLSDGNNQNEFAVVVDGAVMGKVVTVNGQTTYPLATGLASGTHDLLVWRRTEAKFGATDFVAWGRLRKAPIAARG